MTILNDVYTSLNISNIIVKLNEAHLRRDYDLSISLFSSLWDFNEEIPDWKEYDAPDRANLLRLAACFLLDYGKSKNLVFFQERAKDAFTRAIDLFLSIENEIDAMDCRSLQAFAYYQAGAIDEYKILLEDAESLFDNKTHHVYLRIQANFLLVEIAREEISKALKRIKKTESYIKQCADLRTMVMFYANSGIVFRHNCDYDKALSCYEKALNFAKTLDNQHYQALIINSLATTLCYLEKHDEALSAINFALDLIENYPGHEANFIDTKANIYLFKEEYGEAEVFAIQSIELFRKGDDKGGLCEALWTLTKVYIQMQDSFQAYKTFNQIYNTALQYDGLATAEKYLNQFTELLYCVPNGDLKARLFKYKIFLVENSLKKGRLITRAAKILGIPHGTLSAFMRKHTPELYYIYELIRKERSDSNS